MCLMQQRVIKPKVYLKNYFNSYYFVFRLKNMNLIFLKDSPLILIVGKDYGCGSSRDWAAKGPFLLGIKAVIAESYERIHRSNLVGMGIIPLQFLSGQSGESLGITGKEQFNIIIPKRLSPHAKIKVEVCYFVIY